VDSEALTTIAEFLGVDPNDPAAVEQALSDLNSRWPEATQTLDDKSKLIGGLVASMPSGEGQMVSGHYVAPNPIVAMLGAGLKGYGIKKMGDVQSEREALLGQLRQGSKLGGAASILEYLRGKKDPGAPKPYPYSLDQFGGNPDYPPPADPNDPQYWPGM
jgi:hypothetical protein